MRQFAIPNSGNNSLASECHLLKINAASKPKTYTLIQIKSLLHVHDFKHAVRGSASLEETGSVLALLLVEAGSWLLGACEIQTTLFASYQPSASTQSVLTILVSLPTSKADFVTNGVN